MPSASDTASLVVSQATAHPALGIVAAVCAYEVVVDVLNDTLGAPMLPSMRNGIDRFTWSGFGRRMVPKWSLQAGFVAAGFALSMATRGRGAAAARSAAQVSKR